MPQFDVTKTKLWISAAAFATIIPTITYFGIPVPKVAWAQDILQLEEEQLETTIDLYQRELSRQRYDRLKLEREIEQLSEEVPDSYLKEKEYLHSDIEQIEQKIDKASKRLVEIK